MSTTEAPRVDLIRMHLPGTVEFRAADDTEPDIIGTLVGYAARFGVPTVIDSWEGRFEEVIEPGAFRKTIGDRGDKVKVLFNHGFDAAGQMPLGKPSVLEEDKVGLRYEVPLPDTSLNRDLVPLLRNGAIDGSSFRFSVVRDEWAEPDDNTPDLPVRTLKEVKLYELGPVTFPAYEAATAGVRGRQAFDAWQYARQHNQTSPAADPGTGTDDGTPPTPAPAVDDRDTYRDKSRRVRRLLQQGANSGEVRTAAE